MSEETTVILVEDDALLRDGLADFLTLSGFSVTAVGDGLSFYRVVAERPFSVAVIDLGLPDQAGEVLVDYTRRNTSSSIVVITARDTLDTRVACYRTGADLFLGKPVEGRELAAAIESLAARRAGASLPAVTVAGGAPPPAGGGSGRSWRGRGGSSTRSGRGWTSRQRSTSSSSSSSPTRGGPPSATSCSRASTGAATGAPSAPSKPSSAAPARRSRWPPAASPRS